jgi:D-galactarolactone cycloisomerase
MLRSRPRGKIGAVALAEGDTVSRIRDIRLIALEFALEERQAYGMARGLTARRQASIIEVETRDGVVGIGEAWGPATVTAAYLELIRPYYLDRELYDHELIWSHIINKHYHLGLQNQMVTCASGINIACYDALGRTLNVPVCKLLGGKARDRVPVYASGGYITNDPDFSFERQLEMVAERPFRAAKIKIGKGPDSDVERVRTARGILGSERKLMVDVNGNYTVDLALDSMRRLADFDVHFYEEPLPPHDFAGYGALRGRAPIPVATGEALYTAVEFKRLIDVGGADVLQPDLSLCGGLDQARAIALLAQLANLRISPHVWGSAVGLAAAVHFVASLPPAPHTDHVPWPTLVEYDVGPNALRDALLAEPIRFVDGDLLVPDGPGLGITLDPAALKRFRLN